MKILYYDCFSGISGDMNLGAMVDLGVDENYLEHELSKLNISNEFELKIKKDSRKAISGTKVDVVLKNSHEHTHEHHHDHEYHHEHRNYYDIEKIINSSDLNDNVKKLSLEIFKKVGEAESKVHNMPLETLHFHEVGAVDSIVDIVGAAVCIDYLNVDKIFCSSVELGGGFVKCAHGLIPVPAPAVVEILKGVPVKKGAVQFETTTPTGAAILSANVDKFTDKINFKIKKTAYGIGNRDTDIPNVLRVYLCEENSNKDEVLYDCKEDECNVLECNIDDMNPEFYDYIFEKLFSENALDVYLNSIIMKKNRPGMKLSVLCKDENLDKLKFILLNETTTLGVREYKVHRNILKRDFSNCHTEYGDIKIKNAYLNNKLIKSKPEYDDCKRIALENNISINEIYKRISENK